jgi:hypothetical protein
MVGKSTAGKSETGSSRYAITPNTITPSVRSVVVAGRRMKRADRFTAVDVDSLLSTPNPQQPSSNVLGSWELEVGR